MEVGLENNLPFEDLMKFKVFNLILQQNEALRGSY